MIKAENLYKKYRKKVAVDSVSFEVESGKVTGFLGPNGAGKSTTMRLMLGLDNGTGYTTYDGKKLNQYAEPAKLVGVLLEAHAFHPMRSARNHLRVLAAAGGIAEKRVDEVLDIVGLKDVALKKPGKFSLGMSQRLGIAAAILGQPKYLILDEPANGLDPEGIHWFRQFIRQYVNEGNGVLVSSHLLSEVAQIADNVVVIGKGKLITKLPVSELVNGGSHAAVFVRSTQLSALEELLKDSNFTVTPEGEGLKISGVKTDEIGKIAHAGKIELLELTGQSASLEEVFLELTSDAQEYQTHNTLEVR